MPTLSFLLPLLLAALTASAAAASSSVTVHAWPLSASKPAPLAAITYWTEHLNATLDSWTPPTPSRSGDASELVRIGLRDAATGRWTGVATAAEGLAPELFKTLSLHVDEAGTVFGVGFSAARTPPVSSETASKSKGKGKSKAPAQEKTPGEKRSDVVVEVLQPAATKPALNKPVVLRPDGKVVDKEEGEQKSFLQKYWWAIALFLFLQVIAGGGDGKK